MKIPKPEKVRAGTRAPAEKGQEQVRERNKKDQDLDREGAGAGEGASCGGAGGAGGCRWDDRHRSKDRNKDVDIRADHGDMVGSEAWRAGLTPEIALDDPGESSSRNSSTDHEKYAVVRTSSALK